MSDKNGGRALSYAGLVLTFLLWGSMYVAGKSLLAEIPPVTLQSCRFVLAALCLGLAVRKGGRRPVDRADRLRFAYVGFGGYFASMCLQMSSTGMLSASLSSMINALNPLTIQLFAALLLGERLRAQKLCGLAVSLAGIAVILGFSHLRLSPLGLVFAALAVLLWSSSSVVIRSLSAKYPPLQITFYGMAMAAAAGVPASAAEMAVRGAVFTLRGVLLLVYLGVFVTFLTNLLWNRALAVLPAADCSMFYPLQVVSASLLGALVLHERMTPNFIFGGLLVFLGIFAAFVRLPRRAGRT